MRNCLLSHRHSRRSLQVLSN